MVEEITLDTVIKAVIKASEQGYEWRIVEIGDHLEHYFYNPHIRSYDNNLKEMISATSDVQISEFLKYSLQHPIKGLKLITGIYKMRKLVLDRG